MSRGTTLIIEKSHLYKNGRVLRHPLTLATVATPRSYKLAIEYCKKNQYSWMHPVNNYDESALEERI